MDEPNLPLSATPEDVDRFLADVYNLADRNSDSFEGSESLAAGMLWRELFLHLSKIETRLELTG